MKIGDPPDWVRDAFRHELIRSGDAHAFGVHSLSDEISRLRFYLETLEEFIASQEKGEIERLAEQAQNSPQGQHPEFWAWYYPVHWNEIFGSRLRTSFVISLVSFAETQLNQICRDTAVIVGSGIKSNDLKGSILGRSRKFLQIFGEFAKPSKLEWELIIRIYDVRNVLVHKDGCIFDYHDAKRLSQFVNEQPGLSQTYDFIKIEKEFCIFCLEKIESFLQGLREEVKHLCERVKRFESE